jgi:hypothetical protein
MTGSLARRAVLTGAAATVAFSRLRTASSTGALSNNRRVNARDFGAKGDGATNDTTSIAEAITYAASVRLPLYLPAGTYIVTAIVYAPGLAGIYGDGMGSTIIKRQNNAPRRAYLISGTVRMSVEDLSLDGNKANNATASAGLVATTDEVRVRNVESMNHKQVAIAYGWGVYWAANCNPATPTASVIEGCYVHDNEGAGILTVGTAYNALIVNNRAVACGHGIFLQPSTLADNGDIQFVDIVANVCDSNFNVGIFLNGLNNMASFPIQYVNVTGNTCGSNGAWGIVFQADRSVCSSNNISNNGLPAAASGGILGNSSNSIIADNAFINNGTWSIDAGGSENVIISHNLLRMDLSSAPGTFGVGIDAGAASGVVIDGNSFYGNFGEAGAAITHFSVASGGIWPAVASYGKNCVIINNLFYLTTNLTSGINSSTGVTGLTIKGNTFYGGDVNKRCLTGAVSAVVSGNSSGDYPLGAPATAATSTIIPEWSDVVNLTSGNGASVSSIVSHTQDQWAGKITHIEPGAAGSYTMVPSVVITGDGAGAVANALLAEPVPAGIHGYVVANHGSGYTTASATLRGGVGRGGEPGVCRIGYPSHMDGRTITLVNNMGGSVTLKHGTSIKLAGTADCALINKSSITFRVDDNGIWYEVSRALQ